MNKRENLFLLAVSILIFAVGVASAQRPKVEKKEGHISPLTAKVTFADGTTRSVMVQGVGQPSRDADSFYTHIFKGTGPGNAAVTVWLDSIRSIQDTTDEDALFVLKSGTQRRLAWINELGMGGPTFRLRALVIANEDGGAEKIDLSAIKSVEFLSPARQDKENNAMFDHWRYSPFTGEKLSQN